MSGLAGVTDNDWFAFLSQQPGSDELTLRKAGGISYYRVKDPSDSGKGFFR